MMMPMNVELALGRADESLADAQSWMRQESNFGTYANPPNAADELRLPDSDARKETK
jgi:hypothetical protein